MQVFLVYVETGEYADHCETVEAIFDSYQKAEDYMLSRRKWLDELGLHAYGDDSKIYDHNYRIEQSRLHNIQCDYTGTWYSMSGPHEVQ